MQYIVKFSIGYRNWKINDRYFENEYQTIAEYESEEDKHEDEEKGYPRIREEINDSLYKLKLRLVENTTPCIVNLQVEEINFETIFVQKEESKQAEEIRQ